MMKVMVVTMMKLMMISLTVISLIDDGDNNNDGEVNDVIDD